MKIITEIENKFETYKLEEYGKWKIDRRIAIQFYRSEIEALLEQLRMEERQVNLPHSILADPMKAFEGLQKLTQLIQARSINEKIDLIKK